MTNHNFRTALHGFQRDDVVQFIEAKTLEHEKELRQKNDEISRLRAQLNEANQKLDAQMVENRRLQTVAEEAPVQPKTALDAPMAPIATEPNPDVKLKEMELAAYRRAEMVERHARERADEAIRRLQTVAAQSNAQIAAANQAVNAMLETICNDVRQFEQVLHDACGVIQQASECFGTVERSEQEQ